MKKHTLLFFAFNFSVFMLNAQSGIITTVAGRAGIGYNGDNIQATAADLNQDNGVGVDSAGNIYIADSQNNRIRKVNKTSGVITTVAGNGVGNWTGDGGFATAAELDYPVCVRVDAGGDIFISDNGNGIVREVSGSNGRISTIAGNGFGGYSGDNGQATAAEFADPTGMCLDANNNVYVADQTNNVIRKINANTGIITTVAGRGPGFGGYSGNGGQATAADLNQPTGVTIDPLGNMYISEQNNNDVRMVTPGGIISLFAGTTVAGFNLFGGPPDSLEMDSPEGIASDGAGNVFISDAGNAVIWEVYKANGQMYAIAGNTNAGFSGDNGAAYLAMINGPIDLMPDNHGSLYIADESNNRVRKVAFGCVGDTATAVSYNYPECNGGTDGIIVAFAVSPFEPYTYSWSNGTTNFEDTAVSSGIYTVTITDAFGCTGTGSVNITQPAAINVAISGPDSACLNSQVLLSSSASGGVGALTFTWGATGTTQDTLTVAAISSQPYTIYVNDTNGCYDSAVLNITVNPLPNVLLNAQTYSVCITDTSDTLAGSPAGGTYSGPFLTGNIFNPSLAGAGIDTFYYSYTDSLGCTNVALQTVIVSVCTGIPGISDGGRLAVYPNPATDQFTIQLESNVAAQLIELYSITGQEVYESKYNNSQNSQFTIINTQQFPTGVYTLKVILKDGSTLVQKVDIVK